MITELEKQVIKAVGNYNYEDAGADCTDLSRILDLPINTIKGVVGSLNKKGILHSEKEDRGNSIYEVITLHDDEIGDFYLCDDYDYDEFTTLLQAFLERVSK